jgi:hypothetical protein
LFIPAFLLTPITSLFPWFPLDFQDGIYGVAVHE